MKHEEDVKKIEKTYPNIKFFFGDNGLDSLIENSGSDMVVNALVGFVGLKPSITAIKNRKILALANKETLVVGGELISSLLKEYPYHLVLNRQTDDYEWSLFW